jgi:Tfp pilus assembly protein PilV
MQLRPADESGITLPELMVAMLAGLVVLFGIFGLVETALVSGARTADRTETLQRGRIAMETISQAVRSAVCPSNGRQLAFTQTDPTVVTLHSTLGATADDSLERVTLRTLRLEGGVLLEEVRSPNELATAASPSPMWTFPTDATRTRRVVDGLAPLSPTAPVFTYLDANGAPIADSTRRGEAVRVGVALKALPTRKQEAGSATRFESVVATRTDDPFDLDETSQCVVAP